MRGCLVPELEGSLSKELLTALFYLFPFRNENRLVNASITGVKLEVREVSFTTGHFGGSLCFAALNN